MSGWWIAIFFYFFFVDGKLKEIKRLRKRIKRLEIKSKGGNDMSRLLEEWKGQEAIMTVNGSIATYEIVDIDEEWLKLNHTDKKGKETTKLVRIEDVQSVELK